MQRLVRKLFCLLVVWPVACVGLPPEVAPSRPTIPLQTSLPADATFSNPSNAPTSLTELPSPTPLSAPLSPPDCPFAGLMELSAEALVAEVLARNQTLVQMTAAWQAASARFPQVTSLDDPMFRANFAPAAMGGLPDGSNGYTFALSQKYPWCGKLKLRGDNAQSLANAAGNEVEDTRLQLIEAAKDAFADYYLVGRALAVNAEALRLLREFRQNAETRYKTGLVPQQDILQADVELGRTQERTVRLERALRVTIARLNTLMHLPPDLPLPPPPPKLTVGEPLLPASALRDLALNRRPDLKALADRIGADEAALALAYKEYYPDLEPTAAYDSFWSNKQQRYQIGVQLNLPVRLDRRKAAVAEAQARLAEHKAELARQIDQVNYLVQQAFEHVNESERVVRLYDQTILPAARENVKSAQAAYVTGKIPFLTLIEAERDVIGLRDRYYDAVAEHLRRIAALERSIGGSPDEAGGGACLVIH